MCKTDDEEERVKHVSKGDHIQIHPVISRAAQQLPCDRKGQQMTPHRDTFWFTMFFNSGLIFACFGTTKAPSKRQIYLWKSHFEKFENVETLNNKSANRESYLGRKKS